MSHGKGYKIVAPRSKFYQGPFGRICPDLPAWLPEIDLTPAELEIAGRVDMAVEMRLLDVANRHMIEVTEPSKKPQDVVDAGTDRDDGNDSNIPAGYTYFGQFVDHDITFDPASSLMRQNDPSGLLNHRTPRLDLDNLYGGGPAASPHLYDNGDKFKFAIGEVLEVINEGTDTEQTLVLPDLPRVNTQRLGPGDTATAVIGDPRNDENIIVSQLHLAFLLAHNTLFDAAIKLTQNQKRREELTDTEKEAAFNQARTTLHWLYQHIVWNDFLRRISDPAIHKAALQLEDVNTADDEPTGIKRWKLGLDHIYKWKNQPFMPLEFSVAAYRFGHTLVRNSYQTNGPHRGFQEFAPIFDNSVGRPDNDQPDDLRGRRMMLAKNVLQWDWFLNMRSSGGPFPQMTRRFDTKLSNALAFLHERKLNIGDDIEEPTERKMNFLAFRNLLRGYRFDLPSGTSVAKKYCLPEIDLNPEVDIDALWYYILKEADLQGDGNRLGKVGSAIVCATFAGLLTGDPNSYFNCEPCWHPANDDLLKSLLDDGDMMLNQDPKLEDPEDRRRNARDATGEEVWTLASIIRLSELPVDAGDFNNLILNDAEGPR
ncbi:MAG: peroxidase family protein [Chloroflexota bacterium]